MNKKKVIFGVYLALLLVAIYYVISSATQVLSEGELFRFKPRPIDPFDVFRGKYLTLSYDNGTIETEHTESFPDGQTVYIVVEKDEDGYAYFSKVLTEEPETPDYFKSEIGRDFRGLFRGQRQNFEIPFDRYYINEDFAKKAEDEYRAKVGGGFFRRRTDEGDVYVDVRIYHGKAIIEELYFDDEPIMKYLEEGMKNSENIEIE